MFFSKLTELKDNKLHATKEMVNFMKKAFDIEITEEAICEFEYKQTADVDYPISSKQCKLQIVTTPGNKFLGGISKIILFLKRRLNYFYDTDIPGEKS